MKIPPSRSRFFHFADESRPPPIIRGRAVLHRRFYHFHRRTAIAGSRELALDDLPESRQDDVYYRLVYEVLRLR